MLQEFREFISRGNAMDMAVGIIIGAAFTAIVTSLVDDLVNPLIGIFVGGIDFGGISFGLGEAQFMVGNFVNALIKFLIISFVVFMLVRTVNKLSRLGRSQPAPVEEAPAGPTQEELLMEIRDALRAR
ncbi:MAG: large conductance mechanosensitive channel protein MscL [Rhodobacteraceae bacterium]|nr:MAG: large conductance mechanosensitive channel protein MscL [Paracoccaceae bacterium]